MKKILRLIPILYTLYFILYTAPLAQAASEFATSFTSLYVIEESGQSSVEHTVELKNNLANIYATTYSIALSGKEIEDIVTSDDSGPLENTVNAQNGTTTISVKFATPSIGKDKVKTFKLSYLSQDILERIGDTMTINIPRLAKANESERYTRVVKIAGIKDRTQHIYPQPNKIEQDGEYTIYTFVGHQNDSLTLLFGDSVTYKLNLTYELKNKEFGSVKSELALPMDTSYQSILLHSIEPPPERVTVDENGNWMAQYSLASQEKIEVKAELYATIHPLPVLTDHSPTSLQTTKSSKFWQVSDPPVHDLATRLKTPSNIYNYLIENFTYNYAGITSGSPRQGALLSLTTPGSVLCTEFTDSFVALSRALKIPSREINGFGYTKNDNLQPQNTTTDILHAWPEYYDTSKHTWVQVDPTWGNTTGGIDYFNKLDFGHIAFVRHGSEDSYPLPAGAYKSNPSEKYVHVEVATVTPQTVKSTETRDSMIYNTGNVAYYDESVGSIPPYGSAQLSESKKLSFYDKIKKLCANLLSIFYRPQPASM